MAVRTKYFEIIEIVGAAMLPLYLVMNLEDVGIVVTAFHTSRSIGFEQTYALLLKFNVLTTWPTKAILDASSLLVGTCSGTGFLVFAGFDWRVAD